MFEIIVYVVLTMLAISLVLFLFRLFVGPSTSDRILALDCFGMTLIGLICTVMIFQNTIAYASVILVLSILSFIGTVTLSKFIERGVIFERD